MKKTKKPLAPAAVAELFERFSLAGYPAAKFTDTLYRAMSNAFGFIAHYDRAGFYSARFSTPTARVETLTVMSQKDEWFSDGPVETALRAVVEQHDLLAAAVRERDALVERGERAELARLIGKYGLPDTAHVRCVGGRYVVNAVTPYGGGATIEVGAPLSASADSEGEVADHNASAVLEDDQIT